MARTPYANPEAERIFNTFDVTQRMQQPDSGVIEQNQQMLATLTNPNNAVTSGKKKAPV